MELNIKFNSILKIKETSSFYDEKEDYYGIYHVEDDFEFLTTSDYIRSVRRPINELTYLKFNNYLMRKGMRLKTLKVLNSLTLNLQKEYPQLIDFIHTTPIK
jgi:hypothetical protein